MDSSDLQQVVAQLRQENEQLRKQMAEPDLRAFEQIRELRAANKKLTDEFKRVTSECVQLAFKHRQSDSELKKTQNELSALQQELSQTRSQEALLGQSVDDLRSQLSQSKEMVLSHEAELERQKEELAGRQAQMENLRQELEQREGRISNLETLIKEFKEQYLSGEYQTVGEETDPSTPTEVGQEAPAYRVMVKHMEAWLGFAGATIVDQVYELSHVSKEVSEPSAVDGIFDALQDTAAAFVQGTEQQGQLESVLGKCWQDLQSLRGEATPHPEAPAAHVVGVYADEAAPIPTPEEPAPEEPTLESGVDTAQEAHAPATEAKSEHHEPEHHEIAPEEPEHHEIAHEPEHHEIAHEPEHHEIAHEEPEHHEIAHEEPEHHEIAHEEPEHHEIAHEEPEHHEIAHEEPEHHEIAHVEPEHYEIAHVEPEHYEIAHVEPEHHELVLEEPQHPESVHEEHTGVDEHHVVEHPVDDHSDDHLAILELLGEGGQAEETAAVRESSGEAEAESVEESAWQKKTRLIQEGLAISESDPARALDQLEDAVALEGWTGIEAEAELGLARLKRGRGDIFEHILEAMPALEIPEFYDLLPLLGNGAAELSPLCEFLKLTADQPRTVVVPLEGKFGLSGRSASRELIGAIGCGDEERTVEVLLEHIYAGSGLKLPLPSLAFAARRELAGPAAFVGTLRQALRLVDYTLFDFQQLDVVSYDGPEHFIVDGALEPNLTLMFHRNVEGMPAEEVRFLAFRRLAQLYRRYTTLTHLALSFDDSARLALVKSALNVLEAEGIDGTDILRGRLTGDGSLATLLHFLRDGQALTQVDVLTDLGDWIYQNRLVDRRFSLYADRFAFRVCGLGNAIYGSLREELAGQPEFFAELETKGLKGLFENGDAALGPARLRVQRVIAAAFHEKLGYE